MLLPKLLPQAVFLDRDGTIGGNGSLLTPDEFVLFPFSQTAINSLKENGIKVFSFTNQPGISRGETTFEKVHAQLLSYGFDEIYICPHTDEDNCNCRKPKIGMLEQAAQKHNLDLLKCYVIGDSWKDMLAADRVGSKKILVKTGNGLKTMKKMQEEFPAITLDYICENLEEAVYYILNA